MCIMILKYIDYTDYGSTYMSFHCIILNRQINIPNMAAIVNSDCDGMEMMC